MIRLKHIVARDLITKLSICGLLVFTVIQHANSQSISVNNASTTAEVQSFVEDVLLGSCVTVSNISYTGPANASGVFDGSGTVLGLDSGIVLTSGIADIAEGPDDDNNAGNNQAMGGDADLTSLTGIATYDAVILEFDFIPENDTLRFNYIFGSEEYPEYVNAGYNDVFAFLISGPGYAGPFTGGAENIALLPGMTIPVTIDNVNNGYNAIEPSVGPCTNCAYYVDNTSGPAVQYDGYTAVLTAVAAVVPCQSYHIKIAIADCGDHIYDSGVFLQEGSFSAGGESNIALVGTTIPASVYEGCSNGGFIFTRADLTDNSVAVSGSFGVSGSAVPGVDYTTFPSSITIPAGQDSVILYVDALLDFVTEGAETVIVSMSATCTCGSLVEETIQIIDNDIPLTLSTTGTTTICLGQSANLTASPAGSLTPYTSGWDNGAPAGDNVTISPTTTTIYTYTVTDGCGEQTATGSETITVITPEFTVDDGQQCFDANAFSFTNAGSTGGTVTHLWDFGDGDTSTDENPSHSYLLVGTYTVTHTVTYTVSGCTAFTDMVIEVYEEPVVNTLVIQDVSCVNGADGELGTSVIGGTPSYDYLWVPNGEITSSISGLSEGTYSVTVTDANGCTGSASETLTQNSDVFPIAICQNITVQLNASGSVTITELDVDNGSSDNCGIASMTVDPNAFDCNDLGDNPVVLTVTDINGNVSTCNATVTVEDLIPPVAICQDITVQLDGSGIVSITASQVENGSTDNCAIQSISVLPNTFNCSNIGENTVTLTVTDVSGNSSTCDALVTVLEDTDPTALCQDISVQLDASGNALITAGQIDNGSSDNCGIVDYTVNPSTFDCADVGANTVTLTVLDASGNVATCNATVTVEDSIPPNALCQDVIVQLDASGNASIDVNDVNNGSTDNCAVDNLSVSPSSFTCSQVGANAVTLTVTDVNGNVSTCSATVTVEDNISPDAVCQDITVQLDGSGSATITADQIDNGSDDNCAIQNISVTPSTFNCSNIGANTVTLTVTDVNGNVSTCDATVTVLENNLPQAICQDITVQLDASGNATITAAQIDNGSFDNCGTIDLMVDPSTFDCSHLGTNTVTLTVTDNSGVSSTCSATVTVEDIIPPNAICQNIMVQLDATGNASIVAAAVDGGSTDNCAVNDLSVSPNTFTCANVGTNTVLLTVTDVSGNVSTCNAEVTVQPDQLISVVTSPTGPCGYNISCNGTADGEATVNVSGGCLAYSYLWTDGQITQTATGLSAGLHSVTVTDANGAQVMETIVLTEPDPLTINTITSTQVTGGNNISCNGASDGIIAVDILGGITCLAYNFSWTGPNGFTSTNEDLENLEAGSYVLLVTDANGCNYTDSINLTEPDVLDADSVLSDYNGSNISCFGSSDGFVNLSISGGTDPYDVSWTNGEQTQNIDNLLAGTYGYSILDVNGCLLEDSVVLFEPPLLTLSATDTTLVSCNGMNDGNFSVQAEGGTPNYNYEWSNGDIGPSTQDIGVGMYQAIVSDENGCQDSIQLVMTEPSSIDITVLQVVHVTCFEGDDGEISISTNGGDPPYTYNWPDNGQNGEVVTGLSAGQQVVEVTDINGCSNSDSVLITEPDEIILITSNDTTICAESLVPMSVEVNGGGGLYLINWDNGQGFGEQYEPFITQSSNIPISVVDQFGCEADPGSIIVTAYNPVVAEFSSTIAAPCVHPISVDFTNSSTNGISYSWIFGNGDSSTELNTTSVYENTGSYSVVLVAESADGCVDSTTHQLTIDSLPEANFTILDPDGCFPIMVGMIDQSTSAASYFWDFGDGTTSDESNPYHFYENPGNYTVSLIIENSNGCSDTLEVESAVNAYPDPTAAFTPVMLSFPEPGRDFSFTNNSTGGSEYLWTFGSGDQSELFEPTYSYPGTGSYTIVLRVYSEYGCLDTAMASINLDVLSGLYVPNAIAMGEPGEAGIFLPKGFGIENYHVWVFDSWGNQIWESDGLENGSPAESWDGRYKGQTVPQGSYVWKINAIFADGSIWEGMEFKNGKKASTGSVTVFY